MDYDKHLEEILTSGLSTRDMAILIQKLNRLRDISREWKEAIKAMKDRLRELEQKLGLGKGMQEQENTQDEHHHNKEQSR